MTVPTAVDSNAAIGNLSVASTSDVAGDLGPASGLRLVPVDRDAATVLPLTDAPAQLPPDLMDRLHRSRTPQEMQLLANGASLKKPAVQAMLIDVVRLHAEFEDAEAALERSEGAYPDALAALGAARAASKVAMAVMTKMAGEGLDPNNLGWYREAALEAERAVQLAEGELVRITLDVDAARQHRNTGASQVFEACKRLFDALGPATARSSHPA